ncbi:hypothetical protein [Paenibacillus segetis]|uniref:Uncharacterized protein n=1 Tax=Paenibacillus segetis TaxID=1325360 RepID=A0ABQ1YGP5_9BACL|nr:hypothetical protein [Paenibacillus segetis]GGH24635.1 hypothetical protein GCM10008013_24500 [Paenibacillus segetis]
MLENKEDESYIELFLSFCEIVEPWLKRAVIILLIGLCLFQGALRIPELRKIISSADKYEGVPIHKSIRR